MEHPEDNPLMAEIMAEKASAYFARVRRMQAALEHFERIARDPNPNTGAQQQTRREQALAEAAEQVWFFIIQREAMRLPYYDELFADFDIPEEVRKQMGPKQEKS